jgi:transposase-like protein
MQFDNSTLSSLFVPDMVTPEQYYDQRRDDSPIRPLKRLMMAVLEDALRCFQNNAAAKSGPRKRLFSEAEQWLCGDGGDGPFSFETVCETLGIEPHFLRGGLKQWRERQLAGGGARRLARRSPVVRSGRISVTVRRRSKHSRPMREQTRPYQAEAGASS